MSGFAPRLDILPPAQKRLWGELGEIPDHFTLYGGTAAALRLGHRESVDFDFFSRSAFDPGALFRSLRLAHGARILQQEAGTLTCAVDRQGEIGLSFFSTPHLGRIEAPDKAANGVSIAALIDLAATKAEVVQARAEAKDYFDLDAIIASGIGLDAALAAARAVFGEAFNPQISLKALAYFGDGNLATLPLEIQQRLSKAAAGVDLDRLPQIQPLEAPSA